MLERGGGLIRKPRQFGSLRAPTERGRFPVPKLCLGTLTPEALLPIREAELPPSRVPKQRLGTREKGRRWERRSPGRLFCPAGAFCSRVTVLTRLTRPTPLPRISKFKGPWDFGAAGLVQLILNPQAAFPAWNTVRVRCFRQTKSSKTRTYSTLQDPQKQRGRSRVE
uniref:Uncharacterized protein n=1 Tax=Candidatus Kentrum sp. DK TaxID=2126562 RepID=A0A450SB48_9GAMM|nr:MAG: hypothetical protein BECKDK2373B_GA0170837_10243 [Candidatus Kentron sp. DK]